MHAISYAPALDPKNAGCLAVENNTTAGKKAVTPTSSPAPGDLGVADRSSQGDIRFPEPRFRDPRFRDPTVEKAQDGDPRAFQELYLAHQSNVCALVYRMLGQHSEAEDVVQDVFVQVHRSLGNFRHDAKFSTWLYRLTVNVVRMHLRKKRSRPTLVSEEATSEPQEKAASPHEDMENRQRAHHLHRHIVALSEKKRTVLVLHDLQGIEAQEIASIVGAPLLTVRTRLFYARKEVMAAMEKDPAFAHQKGEGLEEVSP